MSTVVPDKLRIFVSIFEDEPLPSHDTEIEDLGSISLLFGILKHQSTVNLWFSKLLYHQHLLFE